MFYLIGRNLLALADAYFKELPRWQALSLVTVCTTTVTQELLHFASTVYMLLF
jgi:hypothetical protein